MDELPAERETEQVEMKRRWSVCRLAAFCCETRLCIQEWGETASSLRFVSSAAFYGDGPRPIEPHLTRFKNSQKQGLPTRKTVNSLTPLLEPAAEKAQDGTCRFRPRQFES